MKKVREVVVKPKIKLFLVGLITKENIEGRLMITLDKKQKMTKLVLLK
jgi:hypothetical protein